jgi:hypothetical protein
MSRATGHSRPAAATRSSVSATVLRAMPSERATARSVAPHAFLRRRISRIRRIDTLSAGIGSPAHRWSAIDRGPLTAQWSSDRYPQVADFRSEWPTSRRKRWPSSSRNQWPTCPGISSRRQRDPSSFRAPHALAPRVQTRPTTSRGVRLNGGNNIRSPAHWGTSAGVGSPASRATTGRPLITGQNF